MNADNQTPALPPKLKHTGSFCQRTNPTKQKDHPAKEQANPNAPDASNGSTYSVPHVYEEALHQSDNDNSTTADVDLISIVPKPPSVPPAFVNPLYFAFNESKPDLGSSTASHPTHEYTLEPPSKPAPKPNKSHSDTDSICFLEKHNLYPCLDSLCQKKTNLSNLQEGNIYDICADEIISPRTSLSSLSEIPEKSSAADQNLNTVQDPPTPPSRITSRLHDGDSGLDIFDLVTFESPLNDVSGVFPDNMILDSAVKMDVNHNISSEVPPPPATASQNFSQVSASDAYDVPVLASPPPAYPPPPPPSNALSEPEPLLVNPLPCPTRPPPQPPIEDDTQVILRRQHHQQKSPALNKVLPDSSPKVLRKAPEPVHLPSTPVPLGKDPLSAAAASRKPLNASQTRRPLPAIPIVKHQENEPSVKPAPLLVPMRSAPEPPPPVPPKPVKHQIFAPTETGEHPNKVSSKLSTDASLLPPPLPKRSYNLSKQSGCSLLGCISVSCDHKAGIQKENSKFYASQEGGTSFDSKRIDNITVRHAGYLYKTGSNRKDFERRWCELLNGRLDYYVDDTARTLRGSIAMKDITGVSLVSVEQMKQYSSCNMELLCFDVSTIQERGRRFLFGAKLPSERQLWMNLLAQTVAPTAVHSLLNTVSFSHAGFLHMKEGASGQWHMAFLILHERKLTVCSIDEAVPETLDLRKAVAVECVSSSTNQSCAAAYDQGQPIYVNMPQKFLYLQGEYQQHTDDWLRALQEMWTVPTNGHVEDQHLTQDNVPVVVDKCLNFVGTHGVTEQGIYRLSGTSSKVKKLLEAFQSNPWLIHLKCEDYSVHDVATTLKRYLRGFPECVLTERLYPAWRNVCNVSNREERLTMIKDLLRQLPEVNYCMLKKLVAHLCTISENSSKNMMPVMNLAPIFGPTLLFQVRSPQDHHHEAYSQTNCGMDIVADLINSYSWLFEVDPKELEKEKKIQQALKLIREAKIAKRPTGDILMGVYIYNKNWGKCLNVKLTPTTTAEELCRYAIVHANLKETVDKLAVFEIVCNEELERPLHHTEKPLAITLRWADWSDKEAKGNYLCIKYNHIYNAIMPYLMARQPFSMFSELKYAEGRSKTFKKALFEFVGAKLTCHKDAKVSKPLGEWNIEDITWYAGAESKRCPPTEWAFTFIDRHSSFKRSKDNPYFGRTVCCNTEEEYHKWIAAMLLGEYPQGVLAQRKLPDLLTS